jgi:hypothetical protein
MKQDVKMMTEIGTAMTVMLSRLAEKCDASDRIHVRHLIKLWDDASGIKEWAAQATPSPSPAIPSPPQSPS